MIHRIHIKNFQSHADTSLDLDPGLNVIVGRTDSGKSAIIRSLKWVKDNRPSGEAFRSNWGGSTSVTVSMDDAVITRLKDDGRNEYLLNSQIFKAFGNDVPEEIQEALNMDETNLQYQLDRPFLLADSPGMVATHFNKLAHLDQIDTGLKNVQRKIREISGTVTFAELQIQNIETELKAFEGLDKIEIELEIAEELETSVQKREVGITNLRGLIFNIEEVDQKIAETKLIADLSEDMEIIMSFKHKVLSLNEAIGELKSGIAMLKSHDQAIERQQAVYDLRGPVDLALSALSLESMIQEYQDTEDMISEITSELVDMEEHFHQHMPEVCPLCGK